MCIFSSNRWIGICLLNEQGYLGFVGGWRAKICCAEPCMYNPLGLLTSLRCGTQPAMRYVCSAVPLFAGHELDIVCMYSSV